LELPIVQKLYDVARIVEYPDGTQLCMEGAREGIFYIVLEGRVRVEKNVEGQKQLIAELGAGNFFGEMALVLDQPRTADVVAIERVQVIEIDRPNFSNLIISNGELAVAFAMLTMKRLQAHEEILLARMAKERKESLNPRRVFVSYSRDDQEFTHKVAADVHAQGIDTWLDKVDINPGESWPRAIGKALDHCSAMLLILSPSSLGSENVEAEWNYFLDEKKPVVPVVYRACSIPFRLRHLQYIDFTTEEAYEITLARLVKALRYFN
jgi:CRP-like cAMP-binding protein